MVGIADTRQTVVVVGIGNHLAFLRHVRRLLGEHAAERIVGKRRHHVALGVRHPHETLDTVVLECGGNLTIRGHYAG